MVAGRFLSNCADGRCSPLRILIKRSPRGVSKVRQDQETTVSMPLCRPQAYSLLLFIDEDLAAQARAAGCFLRRYCMVRAIRASVARRGPA